MTEETAPYGSGPKAAAAPVKRVRTHHLREMKERGEKITMLTAYDMYTAATFDEAGIDLLLVGDSASNNVYGNETSLPVTVDELLPLTRAVARSVKRAMVIGDLPFGSYQASPEQGYLTAVRFMKEAGAHCVKLEGGAEMAPVIEKCTRGGIPVMAHIGFTPQSEHTLGGYRVQGRGETSDRIVADAHAVQEAGAFAVVMEMVPGDVAERISKELHHPHDRHRRGRRLRRRRCSSGRTRSACAPAGWRASSSSTPTSTPCCSTRLGRTPTTYAAAPSPAPTTRSSVHLTEGGGRSSPARTSRGSARHRRRWRTR